MTYDDLKSIIEKNFGTTRPADIAKELEVSPQVVSNWKSRNQVPYKYVKKIRKKIRKINNPVSKPGVESIIYTDNNLEFQDGSIAQTISIVYKKIADNIIFFIVFPIIFLIASMLFNKYSEKLYITYVKILPLSETKTLRVPTIVEQFGLENASGGASGLHSTIMYPEIINSKRLARLVLQHNFDTKKYGESKSLVGILLKKDDEKNNWTKRDIKRAVSKLNRMIGIKKNRGSALLTLSVGTFEPQFSADLAQKYIDEFELLLTSFKIQHMIEKKTYIENRINGIQSDLLAAEEKLKTFREKNRNILTSPALTLNEDRLIREVDVQQEVFITLKSQYEMVQIEMLGEKSMMQVLDPPEAPMRMTKPNKMRNNIFAITIGLILSITLIFVKDWHAENKDNLKFS